MGETFLGNSQAGYTAPSSDSDSSRPAIQDWDPGQVTLPPAHTVEAQVPTPPAVPGANRGSGSTSVDTPSLDVVARNIESLKEPVKDAMDRLRQVKLAPGSFYDADQLKTKTVGANADGGLKDQMVKALSDLYNGLTDVSDAMRTLSKNYSTAEEANGIKAADLGKSIERAQADFGAMLKDTGGAPAAPGGGGGSAPSTGGSPPSTAASAPSTSAA
ncbi:hypothetical protein [Streptomyces lydicus]|uniref:hypothetical protein n=1 Tax=Streptomyces lydicus TaxID=47763 RepID=UPI00286FCAAF|nr:hypothetical protein [Streptomyces lydicus]